MVAGTPMNAREYLEQLGRQSGQSKSLFQQMEELSADGREHECGEKLRMHYCCCSVGTRLHKYMTEHPENVVGDDRFSRFLNSFNDKIAPMIVAGLFKINLWALMRIYHYSIPVDDTDFVTEIDVGKILNCPWHDWTEEDIMGGLLAWEEFFNDKDDEDNMDIRRVMISGITITEELIQELKERGVSMEELMENAKENGIVEMVY